MSEIDQLLARVKAVLARARPPSPDIVVRPGPASVLPDAESIFYRLGVVDRAEGPVALASLRLDAPRASRRDLLIGLWPSKGKTVLATRWVPGEERPLLRRGDAAAAKWTEEQLERAVEERIAMGLERFEADVRDGRGHLDSSGDLLSLPPDA